MSKPYGIGPKDLLAAKRAASAGRKFSVRVPKLLAMLIPDKIGITRLTGGELA